MLWLVSPFCCLFYQQSSFNSMGKRGHFFSFFSFAWPSYPLMLLLMVVIGLNGLFAVARVAKLLSSPGLAWSNMSSALAKKTDCLLRRRFTTERLGLVLKGCFALHKHEFPLHGFELLSLLACRWLLSLIVHITKLSPIHQNDNFPPP